MRKKMVVPSAIPGALVLAFSLAGPACGSSDPGTGGLRDIPATVRKGETVWTIYEKHHLDLGELFRMRQASAGIPRLRDISEGRPYTITLDPDNNVLSLAHPIDDQGILRILPPG